MTVHYDYTVVGSGIAGLTYAIKIGQALPHKNICILTKNDTLESNTRYAQGGVAAVLSNIKEDLFFHYLDTIVAGDYLNDLSIVELTVESAAERIQEIISWGVSFDKNKHNEFELCLEGGHSYKRILHHKDLTGLEIQSVLLKLLHKLPNISVYTHCFAKDLIIKDNQICSGVECIDMRTEEAFDIMSNKIILSTGGIGQVYQSTTNSVVATGDGIAMAKRAGASIENMEFVQFHPTALFDTNENPSFLISEAVRGAGAVLVNKNRVPFMQKYSALNSLAPRDVVARAIELEMKRENTDCVYLDCSAISENNFKCHFPTIYQKCIEIGIHPIKDLIPVSPAAHYLCGGIKTNKWGQTSISHLYALGECASTGLHGANRLASNSLLEALVFAHQAYIHTISTTNTKSVLQETKFIRPHSTTQPLHEPNYKKLKKVINQIMKEHAGIIRSHHSICIGLKKLEALEILITVLKPSFYKIELFNLLTVSKLILEFSQNRTQNKGLYYNTDLV